MTPKKHYVKLPLRGTLPRFKFHREGKKVWIFEDDTCIMSCPSDSYVRVRSTLEQLGKSSGEIGNVIRLLNKHCPIPSRAEILIGPEAQPLGHWIEYMTSRGFKVFKPDEVSDAEIVEYLNRAGYMVIPPLTVELIGEKVKQLNDERGA